MTNPSSDQPDTGRGGTDPGGIAAVAEAWKKFESGLTSYLATMGESDELCIELASCPGEPDAGCLPYAQFVVLDDGATMRTEITGNRFLAPNHRLDDRQCESMRVLLWDGNEDGPVSDRSNWFTEVPLRAVDVPANHVFLFFERIVGVAHPQLLTYTASGPATAGIDRLGLCATEDVPVEDAVMVAPVDSVMTRLAIEPADRDELFTLVSRLLEEKFGRTPTVDSDGDVVLGHRGLSVWIRVHGNQAAIQIFAIVGHQVRSMRAAAVEVGILNRDHPWAKWTLVERAVTQSIMVHGSPFAPRHLDAMIDIFLEIVDATRGDLHLRTGAR